MQSATNRKPSQAWSKTTEKQGICSVLASAGEESSRDVYKRQTPFHPIYYEHLAASECAKGILLAEDYYNELAAQHGISLFGSYDPEKANCTNEDFYDGVHVRRESIGKFFYGIHASLV